MASVSVSETTCAAAAAFDATSTLSIASVAHLACHAAITAFNDARDATNDARDALNAAYCSAVFRDAATRNAVHDAAEAARVASIALASLNVAYDRINAALKL